MREARSIRIGNQTAFSAATPTSPFEYAVRQRFDAFEWFPDRRPDGRGWSETDISPATRDAIRRTAGEHDIRLSVHGSWDANPLTDIGNERLSSQARFAADVGASTFVMHLCADVTAETYAAQVSPLVARLNSDGIAVAIENVPDTPARSMNRVLESLRARALPSHLVGVCFDVGHANLCAGTRNDYLSYLDRLAPDATVLHVHLHENWGDQDSHLTLFTGPASRDASGVEGLIGRLARRKFTGCMILEQWPDPPALLDAARARLLDFIAAARVA